MDTTVNTGCNAENDGPHPGMPCCQCAHRQKRIIVYLRTKVKRLYTQKRVLKSAVQTTKISADMVKLYHTVAASKRLITNTRLAYQQIAANAKFSISSDEEKRHTPPSSS